MLRRMRAWIVAASLLLAMSAVGDETFTVRGAVNAGDGPLPGCTVTLGGKREVISDADGRYAFTFVPPGDYSLRFALSGFQSQSRELRVAGDMDVQTEQLEVLRDEVITLACGGPPCNDTPPETAYDDPLCSDYMLDEMLIEGAKNQDRSAIEYLQRRYESTVSYDHKHRIAAALLGRVPDDSRYWNELATLASDAVRFAYVNDVPTPEFVQWCAERQIHADRHHSVLSFAFALATADERGRPLIQRALQTNDRWLVSDAIIALYPRLDARALAEIGKAIARFPDDVEMLTSLLAGFQSEAADALALSLLDAQGKAAYLEQRELNR